MGSASVVIREIRYRYEDSEPRYTDGLGMMHVYINAVCVGDCPHQVNGWYHKVFPSGSCADDKDVANSVASFMTEFDRGAPKDN